MIGKIENLPTLLQLAETTVFHPEQQFDITVEGQTSKFICHRLFPQGRSAGMVGVEGTEIRERSTSTLIFEMDVKSRTGRVTYRSGFTDKK